MTLSELLSTTDYRICSPERLWEEKKELEIATILHDSRVVKPNSLFICLRGSKSNGHLFLKQAADNGAIAAIVEEHASYELPQNLLCLEVPSTRRAFAFLWSRFCHNPQYGLKIIGVTGTNGKTSTATMLHAALRAAGYRTALVSTVACSICDVPYVASNPDFDPRMTTMTTPDPDTLYPFLEQARNTGVTHVVMEVSSHSLAQHKVEPIEFAEAVFTNLSPEHLDYHHTIDAYGAAKELLFSQSRHATLNCDDSFGASLLNRLPCPYTSCGCVWEGDVKASELDMRGANGVSYFYRSKELCNIVQMQLPGTFTVYNSMLAATSAIHLGVSPTVVFHALETLTCIPGRMERISDADDEICVYLDYAHTEAALRNLLKTARTFLYASQHLIVVFGCGGNRDASKRAPMGACAAELADFSIITSDNNREESLEDILQDILMGHNRPDKRRVIPDRAEAITFAIENACAGDLIILAGKGHEQYEIIGDKIVPFDERKIARAALFQRRTGHTNERER